MEEKEEEEEEGSVDRISGLPEAILHHILSFLPTKDAVRTATTCNTLNQVWYTLPFLDFGPNIFPLFPEIDDDDDDEDEEVDDYEGDEDEEVDDYEGKEREKEKLSDLMEEDNQELCEIRRKRGEFFTFMEITLTRRRMQDLTIHKFRLGKNKLDLEIRQHMHRWIQYLVLCNIKELVLHANDERRWYDLPPILLTAPSLRALTLTFCKIPSDSITLPSLRKLHLICVYLDEQSLREIFNTCLELEDLNLSRILGLNKRLRVSSRSHLKVLTVVPHRDELFDEVLVEAPYLEKFSYSGGSRLCKVDIMGCGCLKHLILVSANITHTSLFHLILKLPFLEELMLTNLNLKAVEISSASLKKLTLSQVFDHFGEKRFGDIKVDAPNLVRFVYMDGLSSVFLKSLVVKEVYLSINEVIRKCTPEELCSKLMQFLHKFDHSEVVTLDCSYFEQLIFPVETRSNILAPLAHSKHLILQGRLQTSPVDVLTKLLES